MGCSASTLQTMHNAIEEDLPSSSSSRTFDYSATKIRRALSLQTPLVHHPPSRKGDTHHLVSLTSTTYGSLDRQNPKIKTLDCSDRKVNTLKTQIKNDPFEKFLPDSVINTWELMDGLDDGFDLDRPIEFSTKSNSFHYGNSDDGSVKKPSFVDDSSLKSKPLWKYLSEESFLSKLDPNLVSSYRRALSSRQLGSDNKPRNSRSLNCSPMYSSLSSSNSLRSDNRIVVYFTSLRGIRKTFEDCCEVRMIFRGFRVAVDERDISMDSMYRKELQSLLGGKAIRLPRVFIRGKHIGGVEEIKQLNELGELVKLLQGFPDQDPGIVCEHCGDARFVLCLNCSGSTKVFQEERGRLKRCADCNENGLMRCPGCCL